LVDNFTVSLVRAAYGVPHEGSPDGDWSKIERVVEAAIARDIYVIIDWHTEGDAWPHHNDAKEFFKHMSAKYGHNPHVIYELWNEPINSGVDSLRDWHQDIAGVIRANDPDNLIIAGSDTWSQYPNSYSISDPNVAYTFHGYFDDPANGAVHKSQFYANVDAAMNQGKAVFVTEFGAQYGNTGGTSEIMDACIERGISMAAWSVNDKVEPWSIFNGFMGSLTDIGRFYQSRMASWPAYNPGPQDFTVSAGDDVSVVLPNSSANLDGSSFDPNNLDVTYTWTKMSGPVGGNTQIENPYSEDTAVTGLQEGVYVFQLTGNNSNDSKSDEVKVTVADTPTYDTVAIKSAINNQYIAAENAGNDALVVNRGAAQGWETFDLEQQPSGAYAIKSHANNMYLAVELYEGQILKARSTSISNTADSWELYWIEDLGNGKVAIKANANGKYLRNVMNHGNVLKADASSVGTWEEFYLENK